MDPKRIMCAVCRKPVECVRWWDELAGSVHVLHFTCHGVTREVRLTRAEILRLLAAPAVEPQHRAVGVAFEDQQVQVPHAPT